MPYPTDLDNWYADRVEVRRGQVTRIPITRAEKEQKYDEGQQGAIEAYRLEVRLLREQYRALRREFEEAQDLIDKGLMDQAELADLSGRRDAILAAAQALKQQGEPTEPERPVPYEPPQPELP